MISSNRLVQTLAPIAVVTCLLACMITAALSYGMCATAYASDKGFDPTALALRVDSPLKDKALAAERLIAGTRAQGAYQQASNGGAAIPISNGEFAFETRTPDAGSLPSGTLGSIKLATGTHDRYIDCIDWSDAPWGREFYALLDEWTDFDGTDDLLIKDSSYTPGKNALSQTSKTGDVVSLGTNSLGIVVGVLDLNGQNPTLAQEYVKNILVTSYFMLVDDSPVALPLLQSTCWTYTVTNNGKVYAVLTLENDGTHGTNRGFGGESGLKAAYSDAVSNADTILASVEGKNDFEKVSAFHRWISTNKDYNTAASGWHDTEAACVASTFAAALGTTSGNPICGGYSRGMAYLCARSNIKCMYVSGVEAGGSIGHAWNQVKINDDWWGDDATWEATIRQQLGVSSSTYLLCGKDDFSDHNRFAADGNDAYPAITNIPSLTDKQRTVSSAPRWSTPPDTENIAVQEVAAGTTAASAVSALPATEGAWTLSPFSGEIDSSKVGTVQYIEAAYISTNDKYSSVSRVQVPVKVIKTAKTADVALDAVSIEYNGAEQRPGVTVKVDGQPLDADQYSVTYSDNVMPGTASVTVTATDTCPWTFSETVTFEIRKKAAGDVEFSIAPTNSDGLPNNAFYYGEQVKASFPEAWAVKTFSVEPEGDDGAALEAKADGTIVLNACGRYTAKATLSQTGHEDANATVAIDVRKRALTVKAHALNKDFDGKDDAEVVIDEISNRASFDETDDVWVTVSSAKFANGEVGDDKAVTATLALAGPKAANYELATPTLTLSANIKTGKTEGGDNEPGEDQGEDKPGQDQGNNDENDENKPEQDQGSGNEGNDNHEAENENSSQGQENNNKNSSSSPEENKDISNNDTNNDSALPKPELDDPVLVETAPAPDNANVNGTGSGSSTLPQTGDDVPETLALLGTACIASAMIIRSALRRRR